MRTIGLVFEKETKKVPKKPVDKNKPKEEKSKQEEK